ncbi:carbon catabolite repressor protein 4 homolog 5 [Olea europaea var. sylvestris]|uniref:carbon catabolite repressor protein 4 homolog 5 n=1 Tax=Olea europaea var. sylvestris TaxID=158386 RepID=UPI000C1D150C|nr:carbon catabolite repressor protein 4 homolog 5 [Olea europaea var. sylvestris]XP_022885607.1 carbon catabolite repressor protein 4 homolog 5 [Olea europaea var. sylvestris]
MGRNRDGSEGTLPCTADQSPPPPPKSSRKRHQGHHSKHSRKKQKFIFPETDTKSLSQSKTVAKITPPNSHKCNRHSHKGRKHRNRKELRSEHSHRKWTYSAHDDSNCVGKVILVSYNILGVENAAKHPQLYRRVSRKYLDWEHRKKLLCKEIRGYKPSILCFQEVDRFDDLNDLLGKDGFKGVHKARAGETCDGCAIFWKNELFTLLHEETIEFQRFGLRNNVAQFCVLKMNDNFLGANATAQSSWSTHSVLVGNIHVLYNPKRGDIKLGQMRLFLEKAYKLSQEWGSIPVVITGDLNSLPQSAMYQFITSSELHVQLYDRRQISGQICPVEYPNFHTRSHWTRPSMYKWTDEELMLATGSRLSHLSHHLKLSSAYAGVPGSSKTRDKVGEPLVTSFHSMFTGTVDYIWHTPELVPIRVLETLPMNILREIGGLPSKKWGSDHLALVCELAIANDGDAARESPAPEL